MSLSNEHIGSKILAKIKIYILTRAALLFTLCYEIPCTLNCWILPSILLVYFSTMLSASSFSIPSSFLMTFNCSWRRYFLWTDLTLSSTSFPIFCCNLLNSYSFLSKPKAKYSLLGISFSDKTSTRSLVSPRK